MITRARKYFEKKRRDQHRLFLTLINYNIDHKKITKKEVAVKCGMAESNLCAILKNKRPASLPNLIDIAFAAGCCKSDIMMIID